MQELWDSCDFLSVVAKTMKNLKTNSQLGK